MKKIKTNTTHKHNNTKIAKIGEKRIINWPEYNKSLKNRGNLSIFISESLIKDGYLVMPNRTGKPGRPMEYADELIEFVLTIRELFHMPLRQVTGFIEFLFRTMGIISGSPDYTTISKRMSGIKVRYQRRINRATNDNTGDNTGNNTGIVMLIDSSGFKVFGEGEWMVRKHGATYHRTWRETHVALDYETRDIIGLINTTAHVHDNTQLKPLLKQVTEQGGYIVNTIIGDGAYDAKENYLLGRKLNIEFLAPIRKDAVEHISHGRDYQWHDVNSWKERNAVVRHVEEFGLDGWMADVDYHRRSLVENVFYRLKTIFGGNLKSRREDT